MRLLLTTLVVDDLVDNLFLHRRCRCLLARQVSVFCFRCCCTCYQVSRHHLGLHVRGELVVERLSAADNFQWRLRLRLPLCRCSARHLLTRRRRRRLLTLLRVDELVNYLLLVFDEMTNLFEWLHSYDDIHQLLLVALRRRRQNKIVHLFGD